MQQRTVVIDPLSCTSLRIELRARGNPIGIATSFVVEHDDASYLITNWHVLAGRNADTGHPISGTGALPDEVAIVHHRTQLGAWRVVTQPLQDEDGGPLWIEHPKGKEIDVAALKLDLSNPELVVHPFDLGLAQHDAQLQPALPVSIIGYPYGLTTGVGFPIWKTGNIASDPDIDYEGKPVFLIDATTRGGMSGSPVVFRSPGMYRTKSGTLEMGKQVTAFLGVYAGRIHEKSEIGRVWRPRVVEELLQAGASV